MFEWVDMVMAIGVLGISVTSTISLIREARTFGVDATVARAFMVPLTVVVSIYAPILLLLLVHGFVWLSMAAVVVAATAIIGRLYREHLTRKVKAMYGD